MFFYWALVGGCILGIIGFLIVWKRKSIYDGAWEGCCLGFVIGALIAGVMGWVVTSRLW